MAKKQITRRDFIKTTAAGALATGLGAPFIVPQRSYGAAKRGLRILQWVHFVPAFDKWFNEKYVKEWGDKNNIEVTVDNIGIAGLSLIPTRGIQQPPRRHDIIHQLAASVLREQVVDMKDVYGSLKILQTHRLISSTFGKGNRQLPPPYAGPTNWRKDLWDTG
jgi:multiple sugar transport system substrate-binding protein